MAIPHFFKSYLDEQHIPYNIIHHRRDFTAQETAAHTHTPGHSFAKTVLLYTDHGYVLAVLPAHRKIDSDKLTRKLKTQEARLADEDEVSMICPDCEIGAMPPIGSLYNLPVIASPELVDSTEITFNAGTHDDVIRLQRNDFIRLVQPEIADFTRG